MSYASMVIREAEAREDDARDHNDAIDALGQAVRACDGSATELAALLVEVVGQKAAAEVITDFLAGDSDALNNAVVRWHRGAA